MCVISEKTEIFQKIFFSWIRNENIFQKNLNITIDDFLSKVGLRYKNKHISFNMRPPCKKIQHLADTEGCSTSTLLHASYLIYKKV